jgi:cytochrome bd-type quinol oxidase subunit 1
MQFSIKALALAGAASALLCAVLPLQAQTWPGYFTETGRQPFTVVAVQLCICSRLQASQRFAPDTGLQTGDFRLSTASMG